MSFGQEILALIAAAVLGSVIGIERELSKKPAGFRTNTMICVGAALIMLVSLRLGTDEESSTRIAAQIVSGVGFLGAGAIIRDRGGVQGLTTAAGIWLVAGVGMACGAGMFWLAVVVTLISWLILYAPHFIRFLKRGSSKAADETSEQ
ncbi:magnesium transport protein MgtC [Limihaloglobus sulfuriphilus]|uniref:Magnesium transport protein MgtC n=1 Tax=Limihaloglobus sulfuriphilus TaxID=1851148 RepID=A0A1Q2MC31_9BACT|nr:MgtC/SapB family protein [Limihaloglobus sulfuriphilus]AQQ70273.1 magnesium transport protein MgtC [Limihaloglobus sulfuriphilus]